MALPDIIINKANGGLGRPLAGRDYVSAFTFYSATLPAGFGASDRIKKVFSIEEAESLGIIEGSVDFGVFWYHVSEFFRIQPQGELFIGIFAVPGGAYDFAEVTTIQDFADGEIRQVGVFTPLQAFATTQVSALQIVLTANETNKKPLSALYAADISAVTDLSTLTDLKTLDSKNVSVVISQDGNAAGAALYVSSTKSVTDLGAKLGAVSLASVHESIGWVEKFKMSNGIELDTPAFANGDLVKDISTGLQTSLNDNAYSFLRKFVGFDGSYNNNSLTATSATSDFATIENNRTIDKAGRDVYVNVLPKVNGPIDLTAAGTLTEDYIAVLKALAQKPLDDMLAAGEISARQVIINPVQNVLATSEVEMTIEIVPKGVSRIIKIKVGFTTQLS